MHLQKTKRIPAYNLAPSLHVAQTPRRPSLLKAIWGAGFIAPPTHPYSSILPIPQGLYLSVAFIHNPRDLNLFPPHCPRLFFLSSFSRTFCFSSVFFSSLACSSRFSLFLFYLFQSAQRFQHPYLQERRGEGEEGGVSIKWNEIWQNTERKKNNKSGIMAATREGEERQRICQQCCENGCFSLSISCKSVSAGFFFLLFFSQAPTMRGDSAVSISLRSQRVWQCFGSATNLNALITNTVTLPPDWEIHFVSSQEMHCIDSAIAWHRAPPPHSTCSSSPKWQMGIVRQATDVKLSIVLVKQCQKRSKNKSKRIKRQRTEICFFVFWPGDNDCQWVHLKSTRMHFRLSMCAKLWVYVFE